MPLLGRQFRRRGIMGEELLVEPVRLGVLNAKLSGRRGQRRTDIAGHIERHFLVGSHGPPTNDKPKHGRDNGKKDGEFLPCPVPIGLRESTHEKNEFVALPR